MAALSLIGIPLGFAFPWALLALVLLPVIWWLLRMTPPRPTTEPFPPTKILVDLVSREETPARSPWWLTLLRLLMAALVIFAMALPIWNPKNASLDGEGPVLLVIDNGWAAGTDWQSRIASATAIINEAQVAGRQIILIATTQDARQKVEITSADALKIKLASWKNFPNQPDYGLSAEKISEANQKFSPTSAVFLSDGIAHQGMERFSQKLQEAGAQKIFYQPDAKNIAVINSVENQPDAMSGQIVRADPSGPIVFNITALDLKGVSVTRQSVKIADGENTAQFRFEIPVELRNDIVRVVIDDVQNAGAVATAR